MQQSHPISPATVVVGGTKHATLWVGARVRVDDGALDGLVTLRAEAFGEEKWFPCWEIREVTPVVWRGTVASEPDARSARATSIEVRPTVPEDVVKAITMGGFPRVPMPVEVIGALHASDGIFEMPTLCAASHEGWVEALILHSEVGTYLRHAGTWLKLDDESFLTDLTIDSVDEAAVSLFDAHRTVETRLRLSVLRDDLGVVARHAPSGPHLLAGSR